MPARISDEDFALLPVERQQRILKDRERSKRTDVKEKRQQNDKKNKEHIKERSSVNHKIWSSKNKEHLKAYQQNYKEANKEKLSEYAKKRYRENKEKNKEYYEKNKETIKLKQKEYNKTDVRIKFNKINSWKINGFKHTPEQFDAIYAKYKDATECELCSAPIIDGGNKNRKCADHHHSSGCFRNVVCPKCNSLRFSQDKAIMYLLAELHRVFINRLE